MGLKKPVTKQWWFWVVIVIFFFGIIGALTDDKENTNVTTNGSPASFIEISSSPKVDVLAFEQAIVTRNIDGDTIEVRLSDGRVEKVRFIGIDTPESTTQHEPYGEEAALYTALQIPSGTIVYLEKDVSETDKYDRLLRFPLTTMIN